MPDTVTLYHPDLPGEPTKTVRADRKGQIELLKARGWKRATASAASADDAATSTPTKTAATRRRTTNQKEKR